MAVSRGCDVVTLVTEDPGPTGSAVVAGPVSSPWVGVYSVVCMGWSCDPCAGTCGGVRMVRFPGVLGVSSAASGCGVGHSLGG